MLEGTDLLAKSLGATYEMNYVEYGNNSSHLEPFIQMINNGEADIFFPGVTMTYNRSMHVALASPLFYTRGRCFAYCKSNSAKFKLDSFLTILLLAVFFLFFGYRCLKFCFGSSPVGKFKYFWLFLLSWNGLSARLVAKWVSAEIFLSVTKSVEPPFKTLGELKTMAMSGIVEIYPNSMPGLHILKDLLEIPKSQLYYERSWVQNLTPAVQAVKSNSKSLLFTSYSTTKHYLKLEESLGECVLDHLCGHPITTSSAVNKQRTDLFEKLSRSILPLRETGLAQKIERKYGLEITTTRKPTTLEYNVPTLTEFLFLPIVLSTCGISISVISLVIEFFWHK